MADGLQEELRRALEEAKRAREDAERARNDARGMEHRLRQEFHDTQRRLRDEQRSERRGRGRSPGTGPLGPGSAHAHEAPGDDPAGAEVRESFDLSGVREVVVDQSAGRLTIRACAEGESPEVIAASNKTPPTLNVRRDGDRLTIAIKQQTGWLFRRRSGATTSIRLRGEFAVLRVNQGYGEVQLRDLVAGTMDIDVGAGTITAYSCRGNVKANVGAGKVGLNDHAGLATCETGTGDVQVDIAEALPGEYRIAAGLGRAELMLPAGLVVHTRASSGIGRSRIEYPNGPDSAPIQVRVDTGVGEVSVKERRAGKEAARPPAAPMARAVGFAPQKAARQRESEELRVLQLLEQGRISSEDAAQLLAALQGSRPPLDEEE